MLLGLTTAGPCPSCSAAAAEQCPQPPACARIPQKGFCGPKKGSVAPSWPEQPGPGRGRVFLPAAAAARAHG